MLNDEQGCSDGAEENYLQTNECGKRNTELKNDNKKTYGKLVNLAADKWRRGDLETSKQKSSANYLYC